MNYKSAIEKIRSERKNKLLLYEVRYVNALRNNPELRDLERQIYDAKNAQNKAVNTEHNTESKAVKSDDNTENKAVKSDINAQNNAVKSESNTQRDKPADESDKSESKAALGGLIKRKEELLRRLDLNPPEPECGQCGDTGYKQNGKPCACVISAVVENQQYKHTFGDFDFAVFDACDAQNAKRAYDTAVAFCSKFPFTNALNLVFLGAIGTGKTFLASCIADNLSKSGYSVVFCSAFAFVNKMLSYHTAPINEKLEHISPLIDCDLLIIDDLGTESMLKNVTAEYFYMILNERMRLNLHTLFTTNLDDNMIGLRYGERFSSRLFDRRFSRGFAISSKDLRKKNNI